MNFSYIQGKNLGEGAYATIYLADRIETLSTKKIIKANEEHILKDKVAIKRIKRNGYTEGLDLSAIRELRALQKINSKYTIKLLDIFIHNQQINIVLEYLNTNLEQILGNNKLLVMPADIKAWLLMILKGTYACHKKFVLHRDIKPNNILVSSNGILKLADFGLARDLTELNMTSNVVTRYYRAPELLLGAEHYSFGVDIWAIGCIFAEMFLRVPFLVGEDDFKQLNAIYKALGTPTLREWPGVTAFRNYMNTDQFPGYDLKQVFTAATDDAIDLLKKMFVYDPCKRITCLNALKHSYFVNLPRPTKPEDLPYE